MIVGALMDMIDVTIVNVALPSIRRDLHASATQLEWVVSGYMLAFAAALIIAGNLGDKFGRKRLFLSGAALFGLASLAAGLSGSGAELIAARVVQGVAAAAMAPQVLATFRVIFGREERGKAFGIYGAMLGFASAVGLVARRGADRGERVRLGMALGLLRERAGGRGRADRRRPVRARDQGPRRPAAEPARRGAAGRLAGRHRLPAARGPSARLAGLGVAADGGRGGRPGGAGPVRGAAVRAVGQGRVAPLLRTELFRVPAFAAGMGLQLAFFAGMQGFFLAFALWLQAGEHFSPLKAGLTAVAFSVGSFVAAPVAVPLAQRHGRRILAGGAVLMVAGIGGVALAAPHVGLNGSPWPIVPGLAVAGAGLALLVIPLVNVVLAAVPAEVAGGASGLFSTAQQLGGALGVALLGTVFFGYLNGHSFEAALVHTAPYAMGAFALCGVLSLLLPRTAVSEEALTES